MTVSEHGARTQRPAPRRAAGLGGRIVVITRPVGTAAALARRVRALGGVPLLLPGLALRGITDVDAARAGLRAALADEMIVFTSPAAVRHAVALLPLRTTARVLAVGQGTARALRRHGIAEPLAPRQQDSEGLLDLPELQSLHGRRVALIGAPGGRGVLREQLAARGAQLRELHVYQRVPPRLNARHVQALLQLPVTAQVLLSSSEALCNLQQRLPAPAWKRLCAASAVVSSERLAGAARAAGFRRTRVAVSAVSADLLAEAIAAA
ncbi:uroporphyrinogen-III synthase [Rhodanobacter sp. AS-Z3]|uniref:uroporphyrinogen-III synthase n=1 Tax=Rhodanobacter sp. AS-Z3 TaxID=3031330 RepID=UPI0024785201|nr:uroporphyrinogen-III synthase [Rhodanobacter sp. AS-Z3]WEN15190.1 uroporphyrinogen-III synthase [Rhodanobacter sp. AS-Z3]